MFLLILEVQKDYHLEFLFVNQIFIYEDYGGTQMMWVAVFF